MDIGVVIDSTGDLPASLAQEMNIEVIPTVMVMEGKEIIDDGSYPREEFYRILPGLKSQPTTAAPAAGVFEATYQKLVDKGIKHIISIHVASLLSGVHNVATVAAQAFGDQIIVVDSGQISMGLGFQAIAAAEAIAQGKSLQAVLQSIEDTRLGTRVVAMLDSLEYVRRSGRVSWTKALIGNFLNLRPFIEVKEGKVLRLGEVRTRRKGIDRLVELFGNPTDLLRVAIVHTNAEDEAREYLSRLDLPSRITPILINITPVIGSHTGPNALGFITVRKPA